MTIETPEAVSTLMQKFQSFYEQFAEFSHDAAELHGSLPVRDDASRAAFSSLSRILAFTDQLNILVSLMREDVRVVEELTTNPVAANWTGEVEHCFYDWLKATRAAAPNVN